MRLNLLAVAMVLTAVCCSTSAIAWVFPNLTRISQPDAIYLANTTKIDVQGADGSQTTQLSNGPYTLTFNAPEDNNPFTVGTVPTTLATWSAPPITESATPRYLRRDGLGGTIITFNTTVHAFGLEVSPLNEQTSITVYYKVEGTTRGYSLDSIPVGESRMIGVTSNLPLISVTVVSASNNNSYAMAQFRLSESEISYVTSPTANTDTLDMLEERTLTGNVLTNDNAGGGTLP